HAPSRERAYPFEGKPCMSQLPPPQDPPVPANRYGHRRSIAEPPLRCSCPAWVFRPPLRRLSFFWSKNLGHPFRSRASTILRTLRRRSRATWSAAILTGQVNG